MLRHTKIATPLAKINACLLMTPTHLFLVKTCKYTNTRIHTGTHSLISVLLVIGVGPVQITHCSSSSTVPHWMFTLTQSINQINVDFLPRFLQHCVSVTLEALTQTPLSGSHSKIFHNNKITGFLPHTNSKCHAILFNFNRAINVTIDSLPH